MSRFLHHAGATFRRKADSVNSSPIEAKIVADWLLPRTKSQLSILFALAAGSHVIGLGAQTGVALFSFLKAGQIASCYLFGHVIIRSWKLSRRNMRCSRLLKFVAGYALCRRRILPANAQLNRRMSDRALMVQFVAGRLVIEWVWPKVACVPHAQA
jgi:hypothetical protein